MESIQKTRIFIALLVLITICSCYIHAQLTVSNVIGQAISIDDNKRMTFDTLSIQSLTNDGGNSGNNATLDNGQWIFYGSQQAGVNSRSERTFPYSLYPEKSVHVLTNWARMSPIGFRTRFLSLFGANVTLGSSGLAPLFEHFNLVEAARFHSHDMTLNNCFSHTSCTSGQSFGDRVRSFYNRNVGLSENIAAGQTTPLAVTMAWINSSGHRANILRTSSTLLGVGYFPRIGSSQYSHYWTQNFASGTHGISNPIVSVSHIQFTNGQLTFLANYYHRNDLNNNRRHQSISLFLENTEYTMNLPNNNRFNDASTSGMGTYEFTIAANTTASAGCRRYYVRAIDSSGFAYYYPSFGYLLTQNENSGCQQHFLAQRKSSDVSTPPIPPTNSRTVNGIGSLRGITSNSQSNHYYSFVIVLLSLLLLLVKY